MSPRRHREPSRFFAALLLAVVAPADPAGTAFAQQTRSEVWIAERLEKAEQLQPPTLNLAERLLVAVERSVDTGLLGRDLLGLEVYGWILLLGVLLAAGSVLYASLRAVRRRAVRRAGHLDAAALSAFPLVACAVLLLQQPPPSGPSGPETMGRPVFYPDDPMRVDPDRLPLPAPSELVLSELYDFLENSLGSPGRFDGPALNVNTIGEVPNSSWYTNRHYASPLSLEALRRGPGDGQGPAPGVWRVVALKTEGKTGGMRIVDARGDGYLLKFDPRAYPEISTGAEAVVTRLLHALGYNVPDNTIVHFSSERLVPGGVLTRAELDGVLASIPETADGRYRALASRLLPGTPAGPFRYAGSRPDDLNDIFPHEARRELRGLRLVYAWVNNVDARSKNTLSMLVSENGRPFLRHHLIDFGTAFGGGPLGPLHRWSGHRYLHQVWLDPRRYLPFEQLKPEWARIPYPDHPAVGHFEAEHFDPVAWVPQYPNPAFLRMDEADAFWAARQIAAFTDEEIRALAADAYTDTTAAALISGALIERRDRIAAAYLGLGGGLDRFRIEDGYLTWEDLTVRYLGADAPRRLVRWSPFDGAAGTDTVLIATHTPEPAPDRPAGAGERVPIPPVAAYLTASIVTPDGGLTRVYLRRLPAGDEIVGLERCPAERPCAALARQLAARDALFAAGPAPAAR